MSIMGGKVMRILIITLILFLGNMTQAFSSETLKNSMITTHIQMMLDTCNLSENVKNLLVFVAEHPERYKEIQRVKLLSELDDILKTEAEDAVSSRYVNDNIIALSFLIDLTSDKYSNEHAFYSRLPELLDLQDPETIIIYRTSILLLDFFLYGKFLRSDIDSYIVLVQDYLRQIPSKSYRDTFIRYTSNILNQIERAPIR